MVFRDRREAGQALASALEQYAGAQDAILLALPRGGVPVAYEVMRALHLPMDIFVVRKLGVPGHEELAMGAIAHGGTQVLNRTLIERLNIPPSLIEAVSQREAAEVARREQLYRGNLPFPLLEGKTVILIDDGLATGATMRAAARAVRSLGAKKIVVAVPVASPATCDEFRDEVDETVCALQPEHFFAVGQFYQDFSATTDDEVRELLSQAAKDLPRVA